MTNQDADQDSDQTTGTGETKAGFVAILGAPNVGKSTLMNKLVGAKVSIVSPKVQTTRSRVLGICMEGNSQVIFMDTPGIFAPKRRLDRAMVSAAWSGAGDADEILLLVDSTRGLEKNTQAIIEKLKSSQRKAIVAINKVDISAKERLLVLAHELDATGVFTDIFMISAETGDGLPEFMSFVAERMRSGPWLFPEDQISDIPERMLAAEITREKMYLQLHQELPYATLVETEGWERKKDGSVKISQVIYVERPSQKAIVLGKGGSKIKSLGASSRIELEELLECRVHLFLFVKVRENWGDDPERYRNLGLDFNS